MKSSIYILSMFIISSSTLHASEHIDPKLVVAMACQVASSSLMYNEGTLKIPTPQFSRPFIGNRSSIEIPYKCIGYGLALLSSGFVLIRKKDFFMREVAHIGILTGTPIIIKKVYQLAQGHPNPTKHALILAAPFIAYEAYTRHIIVDLFRNLYKPLMTA
jgi:hypothetical protein